MSDVKPDAELLRMYLMGGASVPVFEKKASRKVSQVDLHQPQTTAHVMHEQLKVAECALDRALISGNKEFLLIHGKGGGTLRSAIHQWLKTHPRVKGFTDTPDRGATRVYFK